MTTSRVRVGIGLSPDLLRLERSRLLTLIAQINASNIDHVAVTDHVSFRGGRGQDGLAALHYLAGLGVERELHTGVLLLPLRHPTVVARQLLDLADIHPPGVVAGVGLGGEDPDEYSMVGMDRTERGARMSEAVPLLTGLLAAAAPVEANGHYPAAGPGLRRGEGRSIPVLVGGRVDASYERAADADGWISVFSSPSRFQRGAERVRELSPHATLGYQAWIGVGPTARVDADAQIRRFYGIDPAHFERYVPTGDATAQHEHFAPYVEAGATVLNLFPAGDPATGIETVSTLADTLNR